MAQKALRERAASVVKDEFVELVGELQNKNLSTNAILSPQCVLGWLSLQKQ